MAWGLEADELFLDRPAVAAPELNMRKPQAAQITAEAEMPKCNVRMAVDMHPFPTFASTFAFRQIQFSLKAENRSAGGRLPNKGFCIVEPKQTARNVEEFC